MRSHFAMQKIIKCQEFEIIRKNNFSNRNCLQLFIVKSGDGDDGQDPTSTQSDVLKEIVVERNNPYN